MGNYGSSIARTSGASDPLVPEPVKGRRKMARPSAQQLRKLQSQGKAIPNASGKPSFYIRNGDDLKNAIRRVGSGDASHNRIRAYIIRRAKALGLSSRIPDNWNSDGSLKDGDGSSSGSGSSQSGDTTPKPASKDPDGDGDDDTTPSGDTDHDNWTKGGKPKTAMARRIFAQQKKKAAA